MNPAKVHRLGGDRELAVEQLLIVAVAWTQHHAVLAERNRLLIAVGGDVPNLEDGHCDSLLGARRLSLKGFRCIAEKRNRKLARDRNQLALNRIEKFVKATA